MPVIPPDFQPGFAIIIISYNRDAIIGAIQVIPAPLGCATATNKRYCISSQLCHE